LVITCFLYTHIVKYILYVKYSGAVVQLVERRPVTAEVAGSSPVSPDF
jgi:hypothetical protein